MKLRNRQVVLVSIMLFSMFFGAGSKTIYNQKIL